MKIEDIAMVSHEANRAFCASHGDHSQAAWADAPDWQKASACNGVAFHIATPDASASSSHENWMREKLADGWRLGEVKDAVEKTHPCLVAFEELPAFQQAKDHLFRSVVHALTPFLDGDTQ